MFGKIATGVLVCFFIFGYIHDGYHRKNRPIDTAALLGLLLGFVSLSFLDLTTRIVGYLIWFVATYFVHRSMVMFNALRDHFHDTIKEEMVRRIGKEPNSTYAGIMRVLFDSDPYSMKFQWNEKWNLAQVVSFQCVAFGRIDQKFFVATASLKKGDEQIQYQVQAGVVISELEKEVRKISPWDLRKDFLGKIRRKVQDSNQAQIGNQ